MVRSICEPIARRREPKPPLPPDNFNWTVIMVFGGNEVRRLDGTVAHPLRRINEPLLLEFFAESETDVISQKFIENLARVIPCSETNCKIVSVCIRKLFAH